MAFGLSAATVGLIAAGTGAAVGIYSAKSAAKSAEASNQAAIDAAKMDPRQEAMIYGQDGKGGLLDQYKTLGQTPQDPRLQGYGNANLDYLGNAPGDLNQIRGAASSLMSGKSFQPVEATGQAPLAYMQANKIDAPSQNKLDLKGAYNKMIYGDSAANPYLTNAIQGGINQSQQAFGRMQDDSTRNLQDVLGSLRGNSVIAGQYGGSRQGIAEGRALGDFGREQQRAIENFGNNNTSAAVGAQASEYSRGQDRALSAMGSLSGQQYGVASQNAAAKNAADAMNVQRTNDVNADWARRNDAAQATNQQANFQMSQQNNAGLLAGAGLLGSQMQGAAGVGQNQDNYAINKATQTNGLLQPYLTKSNNAPAMQPVYSNTAGSALGGAAAGLGLYSQFKDAFGTTPPPRNDGMGTGNNYNYQPQQQPINTGALTNLSSFYQ